MYNAALSGMTVVDGPQGPTTTLRVKRLNGFTRSRRPDLPTGSPVRFDTVSTNNPLEITVNGVLNYVIGFSPDTAGDEVGPGVLTVLNSITSVADRKAVLAADRSYAIRVGGSLNNTIDDIGSTDLLKLADIRSAVARFWTQNVPEMPDGRFHCHLDPTSQAQIFADPEWQRLLTSLPDYYMYKQFAIGELLNCVFFRNSECPLGETVEGGLTNTFSQDDNFAGELVNASGIKIHRPLFVGQGALNEYYQDLSGLTTEAGITGKVGEPRITNNGIEVFSERIQLIFRAPLNRLQDLVATSWKMIADWPVRTDVTTGDAARFKRIQTLEHGE
jgi:hypothetical protein